jgi:hypothetical protein
LVCFSREFILTVIVKTNFNGTKFHLHLTFHPKSFTSEIYIHENEKIKALFLQHQNLFKAKGCQFHQHFTSSFFCAGVICAFFLLTVKESILQKFYFFVFPIFAIKLGILKFRKYFFIVQTLKSNNK